ncbi:ESX secretion-associated protein EspG [Saccharopolyspora griseoalba]|uniref:ESX secretion-associated protein EspG n=1 Tax=Saccharopolyspora griseoalba TaxID=1431848 RepID=A0ABW2LQG9_9PSEU
MKIELSAQAFHEAWEHFNLGTKPLVLNVLPDGVLEPERRQVQARARDELSALGFDNDMRQEDIEALFLPLARYDRAFDVNFRQRTPEGQRVVAALAACIRDRGTLAVLEGDTVRLQALTADSMARAALSVLPDDVKAGPGKGVSLRSAAMEAAAKAAGSDDRAMAENLVRQGIRRDDAKALVDMAGGARTAYAQVGAAVIDGAGKRHRAPLVTNFFANARGWYFIENSQRSAEAWTTIAPIDKPRMSARVQDLLKAF